MSSTELAAYGLLSRKAARPRRGWVGKRGDRHEVRRGLRTQPCHMPGTPCDLTATSSRCLLEAFCLIQLAPPVSRLLCVRNLRSDQKVSRVWHGWEGTLQRRGSPLGAICSSCEAAGPSKLGVPPLAGWAGARVQSPVPSRSSLSPPESQCCPGDL